MHRFFLPANSFAQSSVIITGKPGHQLRNVLRLKAGDHIIALDNSGWEYEVELVKVNRDEVVAKIMGKTTSGSEPQTKITLYQALLKAGGMELILQKCTEVGLSSFVPVICERCVAKKPENRKIERWRDIICEAAEQSGRSKLPILHEATSFSEACKAARGLTLLPWEEEKAQGIREVLKSYPKSSKTPEISIFIGPEGGFTEQEVEIAKSCSIAIVSLGSRILRANIAGLVASAVTLYEFGEMDIG